MILGTTEMLVLAGLLGGITATLMRRKTGTRNRAVYFILGFTGGILSSLFFSWALYASHLALIVYGILGGWMFAYGYARYRR